MTGFPGQKARITTEEVRLDEGKPVPSRTSARPTGSVDHLRLMPCSIYRLFRTPIGVILAERPPESGECRLIRALRDVERIEEMELGVASLECRQTAARERLEQLLGAVDSDPKGSENRPHNNNYKPDPYPEQDTVIAAKQCSGAGEGPVPQSQARVPSKQPERGMVDGIAPDELVRFAPKLKPYLRGPHPTWPDIVEAADWLRHDLGVSKSLWGKACIIMGRELATVALAVISAKEPGHFQSTPGGYFHGMVEKAKAGELYLDRTIWAWRRVSQPDRNQQGRGGSPHRAADRRL